MIHAKSLNTSLLRTLALVLTLIWALIWSGAIANAAAGRNGPDAAAAETPGSSKPAGNPADGGAGVPDRGRKGNPDTPAPPRGDQTGVETGDTPPHGPRPGGDGPGVGELPPAVVILDLLRRLPQWPPRDSSDPGNEADDGPDRTPPRGDVDRPGRPRVSLPKPPRVVVVAPGVPFTPKPQPRSAGAPPAATGPAGPDALDREVIVTLQPGADDATVFALAQDFGLDGQTLYTSMLLGTRVVRFLIRDQRTVAQVVQQLSGDARVDIAAPHYVYTASQGAAKPLPVPQYAPQKLRLAEAHALAQGKRVKIAVIDTSVDVGHPVFKGARIQTFDALGDGKGAPEPHGTAIAGIVGARAQMEGVAPAAEVLSVRAFTAAGQSSARSYTLAILKGLDWAALNGARVVNMSFAGPADPVLEKAIAAADAQGMILVAAAGNGGPSAKPAYPAAYDQVLAVTATDDRDGLYKDANRGAYIAIAAPGVDIVAAAPGGAYDISSGTSLAAAHISGIAALMLERNPKLSGKDVLSALRESAHKLDGAAAKDAGAGVADAAGAIKAVN